jgi:uncharacterized protein YgfB (UPF0149 family)
MKRTISSIALLLVALTLSAGSAETSSSKDEEQLKALIQEIQAQQTQIAENQTKVDSKMAEVVEAIRVARIFAGRGGH